ncbi:DUF4917 family protein [Rahnella inusitata]|uniref:DUF4917 family protein n=1 Tax=Rahnella inusitata TaxID=58169 RepID=UPI0039BE976C
MPHQIYNWIDISRYFNDSIILGNGASISIFPNFTYRSLKQHATEHGLLNENVQRLFEFFDTNDFELILRLVWQANNVNIALRIEDQKTRLAYEHVRDCLINSVRSIHPEHGDVVDQFPSIASFLSDFNTVFSLNYDLTLYWVMMSANSEFNGHTFKDCMLHGQFDTDWERFRESRSAWDRNTTLVFYPHGSLVLARDIVEQEYKLGTLVGNDLLRSILASWQQGNVVPLFVSEGTSNQKMAAINNSHYLNIVYREVIPKIGSNLTIFGWGMGEHDIHILKRIKKSRVLKIAVSVFGNDQAYCNRVAQMVNDHIGMGVEVVFFDSNSHGCWNN